MSLRTVIDRLSRALTVGAAFPACAAAVPGDRLLTRADGMSAPVALASPEDPARMRRTAWLMGAGVGAVNLYGMASWWGSGFEPRFKVEREGWFGPDTEHGGQDKLGHFLFSYAGGRLLARGFETLGHGPGTAVPLGVLTTYGALTAVEFVDGFAKRWSFSPEDFLMNTAGALAAVALERDPRLDRLVDFRVNYRPSTLPDGRRRDWEPFSDYGGQTYYLVVKAEGVDALDRMPVLRYLELSLGYGARGFEDGGEPARFVYAGVSVNLGKLAREHALCDSALRTRRVSDNLFEYVQFQSVGTWSERRP